MSNTVKLFLAGTLPLAAGYILNGLMLVVPFTSLFLLLISAALLVLWGFCVKRRERS
ncbi:MAG: hypothetical protein ACOX81_00290 [Candidatus Heteroscillospira sp.]|jgi:hypothetical protein